MAKASSNIFWLSVSRSSALILLFLAYTQLFRYLGPFASGQFQFVLSYVAIFGILIDFGLAQYIIKKMSEDRDNIKKYFHNFLAAEIFLAILVYMAAVAIAFFSNFETLVIKAIAIGGVGVLLNGLTYPFLAVLSGYQDLKKVAIINFIASLVNVVIIGLTIVLKQGLLLLVTQQVIYSVIALVLYYRFIQKYIPKPDVLQALKSLDLKLLKAIFIAAFPFALLVGFSTIYNRIDIVLITKILDYTQTGYYTAAYKFFDLLGFFPAVVSHALYPVFASLMAVGNRILIKETLEKYLRLMFALALPMAVGGMLLAGPVISLIAGQEFSSAVPVLRILVWAPAALFMYIVANALVISQLTKYAVIITGVNVVINVIGNIILLPIIGIKGAAIMTVVSETIQGLFYLYFVYRKITKFDWFTNIWKPALASGVMGLLLYYSGLTDSLFYGAPFGLVVYVLVLLALRFFKSEDIKLITNFIKTKGA